MINTWLRISTSFWLLDIVVSFFSAVYLNETLLYRLRDIAFHYLRSWFFFDVAMPLVQHGELWSRKT